jgi:hypothetical protein
MLIAMTSALHALGSVPSAHASLRQELSIGLAPGLTESDASELEHRRVERRANGSISTPGVRRCAIWRHDAQSRPCWRDLRPVASKSAEAASE